MCTAIMEIEAIVSSRPLSYVHPDDLQQPLTPSYLSVEHRLLSLPDDLTYFEPEDDKDPQGSQAPHQHVRSTTFGSGEVENTF